VKTLFKGGGCKKNSLSRNTHISYSQPVILIKSQVFLSSINELCDERNMYDIEFRPASLEEGTMFNDFLRMELGYRRLERNGTVAEKRKRLHDGLEAEQMYSLMTKLVSSFDQESAFCTAEDTIPCIMHGGNRSHEKLFMMILIEAWESCETNEEKLLLIKTVKDYINSVVFGTVQSKAHWKLPVSKESELEMVSFTAWWGKKALEKLADIAKQIFLQEDQGRLLEWQSMLSKCLEVMQFAF